MPDKNTPFLLIDGEPASSRIDFIRISSSRVGWNVCLKGSKEIYTYSDERIAFLREPIEFDPKYCRVYWHRAIQKGVVAVLQYQHSTKKYWRIWYSNGMYHDYNSNEITVSGSCLKNPESRKKFEYLRRVAEINLLTYNDGKTHLLAEQYINLNFIGEDTAASPYLNPGKALGHYHEDNCLIFPFAVNASQMTAIEQAFASQISIIQGPPGTGKTQTILNIIANCLLRGKTVLVVSNNNSATQNILDKLQANKLNFIAASLGSKDNKEKFLQNQPEPPLEISQWQRNAIERKSIKRQIRSLNERMRRAYVLKNNIAETKQELNALREEARHFHASNKQTESTSMAKSCPSSYILHLLLAFQTFIDHEYRSPLFRVFWALKRVVAKYRLGLKHEFSTTVPGPIMAELQSLFYKNKIHELEASARKSEKELADLGITGAGEACAQLSTELIEAELFEQQCKLNYTPEDNISNYIATPQDFLKRYPVVLSTTFSAKNCFEREITFDYVIMDEASQVSIETGFLALTCAENAVIVGDSMQLTNIVPREQRHIITAINKEFNIPQPYDCAKNSFLQSICSVRRDIPSTMLREHYRCHPKIIGYCNQHFYNGKLIVMTKDNGEDNVISVIKSPQGNHATNNYNQREIDIARKEVIPLLKEYGSIGIITPYANQAVQFRQQIPGIEADTIHKYQGRERDAIVLSTVDNDISDFSDAPNLINVAVSRARKKLVIITSGNTQKRFGNISELIAYAEYNNFTVTNSNIHSIFDYLYSQYTAQRIKYLSSHPHISAYASENLTYAMITKIISERNEFRGLKVACHIPLRMIFANTSKMSPSERTFASNYSTHVDFLVYGMAGKKPVAAIETDGYAFHNSETHQHELDMMKNHIFQIYGLPLLRLSTKGSDEQKTVTEFLAHSLKNDSR